MSEASRRLDGIQASGTVSASQSPAPEETGERRVCRRLEITLISLILYMKQKRKDQVSGSCPRWKVGVVGGGQDSESSDGQTDSMLVGRFSPLKA